MTSTQRRRWNSVVAVLGVSAPAQQCARLVAFAGSQHALWPIALSGICFQATAAIKMSFLVTFVDSRFPSNQSTYTSINSVGLSIGALAGYLSGGWVAERLRSTGHARALFQQPVATGVRENSSSIVWLCFRRSYV